MFTCGNTGGGLDVFPNGAPFLKVLVLAAVLRDGREVTMKPDRKSRFSQNPYFAGVPSRSPAGVEIDYHSGNTTVSERPGKHEAAI